MECETSLVVINNTLLLVNQSSEKDKVLQLFKLPAYRLFRINCCKKVASDFCLHAVNAVISSISNHACTGY